MTVESISGRREHKHEVIARLVKENLGPPGSTLPSEADLIERYKVARGTVRQALATLEAEGLITSSQGNLRTVRDARRWRWDMSTWERSHRPEADAWTATVKDQGGQNAESSIRVEFVAASEDVAAALDLAAGTPLITRSRVHTIDGDPHQLSDSFYPPWVTQGCDLYTQPSNVFAPGGLLAASGHPQVRFHDTLTARPPSADEAARLRMPSGTPLLIHTRTGYDDQDRPVRHIITRMAADRVEVSYDLPNGQQ